MTLKKKGMTFIEIMITVIIIIILSYIAIPNYERVVNRSKVTPQLTLLINAIRRLHGNTGQWPHGDGTRNVFTLADWKSGAAGLLMNDAGNPYPYWSGPYMESGDNFFLDPWGNPIFLDGCPDTEPGPGQCSIASGGPDGVITSFNRPDERPQGDDIIVYLR